MITVLVTYDDGEKRIEVEREAYVSDDVTYNADTVRALANDAVAAVQMVLFA